MKTFSASTLGLALALLACTALATSDTHSMDHLESIKIDPSTLMDKLEKLGVDTDFSVFTLPGWDTKGILAADKVTLALLPPPDTVAVSSVREIETENPNENAKAIFSWLATETHIVWKLSLFKIKDFTGAHLHLNTPEGPIVQHLVPERAEGDFIAPIDIPKFRVYVGSFGISELKSTLGVTSIREFIRDFVSQNEIYVNVHGPGNAAILRGFLNA